VKKLGTLLFEIKIGNSFLWKNWELFFCEKIGNSFREKIVNAFLNGNSLLLK
jgi:hypothetical protein